MSIFLGATVNDEHTLRDWKAAITNADVISVPEANTVILEVLGRNGNLDLSEALTGDVTYRNREIKLELASNTHVVSIDNITFKSSNRYGFTYYLKGTISVDGTQVFSCTSASGSHHVRIDSQNAEYSIVASSGYSSPPWKSGSITGNTDGTKSVTISFSFDGYTTDERGANGFNTTGQATVALYTIPRKSSCSMSATNLGSTGTISISLPQKFIGKEKCKLLYLSSASSDQNVEPKGFCYSMKA